MALRCIFHSLSYFLVGLVTFGSLLFVSTSDAFQLQWSPRSLVFTTFPQRSFQKHQHILPTNVINSVTSWKIKEGLCAKTSRGDDDNDDDPQQQQPRGDAGMAQAFRDLDALTSLSISEDDAATKKKNQEDETKPRKIPVVVKIVDPTTTTTIPSTVKTAEAATPEEEVKLYAQMVQELEENNEDDLYSNVLTEMGGTILLPSDQTTTTSTSSTTTSSSITADDDILLPIDEEAWMNRALQEALEEAKKTSSSSSSTADFDKENVLNDQQLMKEIVQVFDQAHEKLMASLEEIRSDQTQWTADQKSSSLENSQEKQVYRESAERLTQAESTLSTLLNNVQKETQSVEVAVQELERAQQQLDDNVFLQLRKGGVIKQVSLVGALLFALRAVGYIVTTDFSSSSPDSLPGLLWQVGLAVVFAVVYALV